MSMIQNVLLTHERFLPDFAGGGEYIVYKTAQHLRSKGVRVRVLTTGEPGRTSYEGIETIRLPMHRYHLNLAVRQIARLHDVDLIQTFNYHACLPSLLAGKWLRKPVVCLILGLFHEAWKAMRGPLVGRAFMQWEKFLLTRDFARVIFLSEYSRALGIALGVDSARSIVNSPGIDLHAYQSAAEKEDVVLFVGKLEARKGIDDVLAVARALPQVRFRVIGWGPQEAMVRSMAAPNVELAPFAKGKKLQHAFASARIFLFPSAETFGLALLEAMASGCAVISTVPLEFAGVLVPTGDHETLVAAVRRLWSNREETRRMGQRNVELAREYTWERYTTSLLATYQEVLQEWY